MSLIAAAATVSQVLLGTVLFGAAMWKAVSISDFAATLELLGVPPHFARKLAWSGVCVEASVGAALLALPSSEWPRIMVGLVAIAFAVAGVRALTGGRRVACGCFGNIGRHDLGWFQITALPIWMVLAYVAQQQPPTWSWLQGLLGLSLFLMLLMLWSIKAEFQLWSGLRGSRIVIAQVDSIESGVIERMRRSTP